MFGQQARTGSCGARHKSGLLVCALLNSACTAVTTVDLLPDKASDGTSGQAGKSLAGPAGASGGVGLAGNAGAFTGTRLVNRYDFSGTGTVVVDAVSGKNGEAMGGAVLDGSGQLTLAGDQLQYVKLPSWLISSMTSVTLVTFFTWRGGFPWQSVFNFGATDTGEPSEVVQAQFFFTPLMSVGLGSSLHVEITYGRGPLDFVDGPDPFPTDARAVVVAVFDGELQQISLYINGLMVLQPDPTTQRLAELKDANCWLGRSQWQHDVTGSGNFRGSYDEFRIYDGAMSAEQIRNLVDPNLL